MCVCRKSREIKETQRKTIRKLGATGWVGKKTWQLPYWAISGNKYSLHNRVRFIVVDVVHLFTVWRMTCLAVIHRMSRNGISFGIVTKEHVRIRFEIILRFLMFFVFFRRCVTWIGTNLFVVQTTQFNKRETHSVFSFFCDFLVVGTHEC